MLSRRFIDLIPNSCPWALSDSFTQEFTHAAKKVGSTITMCVLKTWANSWVTSYRFHEDVLLDCIFGCDNEQDTLVHYLNCTPLWYMISSASRAPACEWDCDAGQRIGATAPTVARLTRLAIAFQCYHTIRLSHADVVLTCCEGDDHSLIIDLLLSLARYYRNEHATHL